MISRVNVEDYVFLVDIEKTRSYYKNNTLCDCVCCRNYYVQVRETLPELADFLALFGVDISRPDEAASSEEKEYIDYISVDYTVCGSVETMGDFEIDIYNGEKFVSAVITDGFVSPNEQTGKYFTITVVGIELPWMLEGTCPEPVSTKVCKSIFRRKRKWN